MIEIPVLTDNEWQIVQSRYESSVDRSAGEDACHPWVGRVRNSQAYGAFNVKSKTFMAHRVGWFLSTGKDLGPLVLRHVCDNPPCQNPRHWLSGTQKDNVDDRERRGRGGCHRGESRGLGVKLTDEQVLEIRVVWMLGYVSSKAELGRLYGITRSHVGKILDGSAWGHLVLLGRS